ncbi:hypothetical protein IscW_ISCW020239 [Ixodes scapularis]|uniref:Uncharacterized protein n=1 Tax=Ixodes scapularis TaxID=6945 RepID=B7Q1N1_IXOSC|nr:hypothetical protein IscW_ISCW020239 [Ixodes scapularis]|eukprot:XP_002409845.1 hypothetical protein IscW_ISCW020239 [Ixodes scapularis]
MPMSMSVATMSMTYVASATMNWLDVVNSLHEVCGSLDGVCLVAMTMTMSVSIAVTTLVEEDSVTAVPG